MRGEKSVSGFLFLGLCGFSFYKYDTNKIYRTHRFDTVFSPLTFQPSPASILSNQILMEKVRKKHTENCTHDNFKRSVAEKFFQFSADSLNVIVVKVVHHSI